MRRARPRAAIMGAMALTVVVVLALGAPRLATHRPWELAGDPAAPPRPGLPLGTNALGQDLLSHLLYGARTSLLIGVLVAAAATALSGLVGTAAGAWARGRGWLLAATDLFLALPGLPIAVLVAAFLGPGFWTLVIALTLVSWAGFARITSAQVAVTLRKAFVEAGRAAGASEGRILRTCVLPEVASLLFSRFLLTVRWAILMEATLALLGLADPARVSWGLALHQAFSHPLLFVTDAWRWWALPPALAVVVTSLGLAAVGHDLDLWLNPAAHHRV